MTTRDLGAVGLKLIGLMAIVQALQVAVAMFGYTFYSPFLDAGPTSVWSFLPGAMLPLVMVALGVSLVAYAGPLAARIFPERRAVEVSFGAQELSVVLFAAVGAFLVVESAPAVLRDVVALRMMSVQGLEPVGGGLWGQNGLDLAESLLRTLLGLFLLLGGRGVGGLVRRLRRAGTGEPE